MTSDDVLAELDEIAGGAALRPGLCEIRSVLHAFDPQAVVLTEKGLVRLADGKPAG